MENGLCEIHFAAVIRDTVYLLKKLYRSESQRMEHPRTQWSVSFVKNSIAMSKTSLISVAAQLHN